MPADLPAPSPEGSRLTAATPPHAVIRGNMHTPSFWDRLEDWWFDHPKQTTVIALAGAVVVLFFATLWLAARPAEVAIAGGSIEPVAAWATGEWLAVVKDGQDLGDVGKPYGVSRMQMIAWNMDLIRSNTAKCQTLGLTSGICTLGTFAGETLAWDALWKGDKAVVAQETR